MLTIRRDLTLKSTCTSTKKATLPQAALSQGGCCLQASRSIWAERLGQASAPGAPTHPQGPQVSWFLLGEFNQPEISKRFIMTKRMARGNLWEFT